MLQTNWQGSQNQMQDLFPLRIHRFILATSSWRQKYSIQSRRLPSYMQPVKINKIYYVCFPS